MANNTKAKKNNNLYLAGGLLLVLALVFIIFPKNNREVSLPNATNVPVTSTPQPTLKSGDTFTSPSILMSQDNKKKFYFTLQIPEGWNVDRYQLDNQSYFLSLKKGDYNLTMAMPLVYDGAICNFENPNSQDNAHGIYYSYFDQINTNFGTIRMARKNLNSYEDKILFHSCQAYPKTNNWNSITDIGVIEFETPKADYNNTVVKEMENIVKQAKVVYVQ